MSQNDAPTPFSDEVVGYAPSPSRPLVVWMGDAPGYVDDQLRKLWSGPAGQVLRDAYIRPNTHNILTNVLDTYSDAKPPSSAYTARHPLILAKLRALSSVPASHRILIAMGAEPARFVHHLEPSLPKSISKALGHQLSPLSIDGVPWTVLYTYNPAHILKAPNLARAADTHLSLLDLLVEGRVPERSRPTIIAKRPPTPSDPVTGVLDIETYGAVESFSSGRHAPTQKDTATNGRFHPARSLYEDRPERAVVTVSITLPATETASPQPLLLWDGTFPHSRDTLSRLRPGPTFTLNMEDSADRILLYKWINHFETIIGHNLLFDLQYLTFCEPLIRSALTPFSKHLIDSTHLTYLHDETRPEKSLKTLGPLLGIYAYEETLAHRRFKNPRDRGLHHYAAEDTHNTLLLTAMVSSLICRDWASTDKASHECLAYYSRTMWSVLPMLEKGVAFSTSALLSLKDKTQSIIDHSLAFCTEHGLKIAGKGSKTATQAFVQGIVDDHDEIRTHPLLALTEVKKEISVGILNLKLCQYYLKLKDDPTSRDRVRIIDAWIEHLAARKLMSSYIQPRLYSNAKDLTSKKFDRTKLNRSATLIPEIKPCSLSSSLPPSPFTSGPDSDPSSGPSFAVGAPVTPVSVAYPRVYITPSVTTDSSEDEGGTEQMRLVFKGPALQTDPPPIQKCITSRLPGNLLWAMDLSQIEMRVPALFSGEPKLIDAFERGLDLHTDRAISVFDESFLRSALGVGASEPITKTVPGMDEYRQVGKIINFSDQFWAQASTMQTTVFKEAGIYKPISIFNKAVSDRPTYMPALYAWQMSMQKEASEKHYLDVPLLGLTRHFVGGSQYHLNKILNFRVQLWAAATLIDIQHRLIFKQTRTRHWYATYQVYDALKGEVEAGHESSIEDAVASAVHECETVGVWAKLQSLTNRTVPLRYDFSIYHGAPHAQDP
jgi:uracil-DNA glycosylase